MTREMNRRDVLNVPGRVAACGASLPAWAQRKRNLKIGNTASSGCMELDGTPRMPITALETATIAKSYLEKQNVAFRKSR
jgi:hypothetical protein